MLMDCRSTHDSQEQMLVADVVDDFCCLSHTKLADVVGRTRVVGCSMMEKEKHLRQPSTDYFTLWVAEPDRIFISYFNCFFVVEFRL